MRTSFRSVCLRTRHSTRVMIRVQRSPQRKSRARTRLRVCAGLPATARLVYSPRLVMDDYAGEDLLRRQAVVSVDDDGRVADAESFAEVVIFVRDALRELYDVYVVGHWDIDAILAATYEEVALHVGLPRVCGLWHVFSESRKTGRITQKPAPEACVLMKRNSGAEMTVLNLWHFFGWGVGHVPKYLIVFRSDMPRNATQQKAGLVNPA